MNQREAAGRTTSPGWRGTSETVMAGNKEEKGALLSPLDKFEGAAWEQGWGDLQRPWKRKVGQKVTRHGGRERQNGESAMGHR